MGCWEYYVVCKCGWKKYAPFKSFFHANVQCCDECGASEGFVMKRMRWNDSKIRILKPSTWGSGFWEIHKDDK